jgi:hypothetical protein
MVRSIAAGVIMEVVLNAARAEIEFMDMFAVFSNGEIMAEELSDSNRQRCDRDELDNVSKSANVGSSDVNASAIRNGEQMAARRHTRRLRMVVQLAGPPSGHSSPKRRRETGVVNRAVI